MAAKGKRYPGAGPFSELQAGVFCGRSEELKRLIHLLGRQKQVLVYAKSGVGKSSLLNAGLIPALAAEPRRSIKVRFYPWAQDAIPPITRMLQAIPPVPADSYLKQVLPEADGIWMRFKAQQAAKPEALLLVFDQFEELFSYPTEQIEAFKREMSELLYDAMPDRYQASLQAHHLDDALYNLLFAPLDLKLVAAIREDKLSFVHQLSDALPDLRHNVFELKPLAGVHARAAIVEPAQKDGDFHSPKYLIEEDALDEMLMRLTKNAQQPVELTLLQIVCQQLENDVAANPGMQRVRRLDLPQFQDILKGFYGRVMRKVPKDDHPKARMFVENELIQENVRVPVAEQKCLQHIESATLKLLADEHLIRAEQNSTGGLSYELSHDILVEPILALKLRREEAEARVARQVEEKRLRVELIKEQAARIKEQRRLQLTQLSLAGAMLGGLVALAAFIYATNKSKEAVASERKAQVALAEAQEAKDLADSLKEVAEKRLREYQHADSARIQEKVQRLIVKAESFKRQNELKYAIQTLREALDLDTTNARIRQLIQDWTLPD